MDLQVTFLFLGHHVSGGRLNDGVMAKFIGNQCKCWWFHYSRSIILCHKRDDTLKQKTCQFIQNWQGLTPVCTGVYCTYLWQYKKAYFRDGRPDAKKEIMIHTVRRLVALGLEESDVTSAFIHTHIHSFTPPLPLNHTHIYTQTQLEILIREQSCLCWPGQGFTWPVCACLIKDERKWWQSECTN